MIHSIMTADTKDLDFLVPLLDKLAESNKGVESHQKPEVSEESQLSARNVVINGTDNPIELNGVEILVSKYNTNGRNLRFIR